MDLTIAGCPKVYGVAEDKAAKYRARIGAQHRMLPQPCQSNGIALKEPIRTSKDCDAGRGVEDRGISQNCNKHCSGTSNLQQPAAKPAEKQAQVPTGPLAGGKHGCQAQSPTCSPPHLPAQAQPLQCPPVHKPAQPDIGATEQRNAHDSSSVLAIAQWSMADLLKTPVPATTARSRTPVSPELAVGIVPEPQQLANRLREVSFASKAPGAGVQAKKEEQEPGLQLDRLGGNHTNVGLPGVSMDASVQENIPTDRLNAGEFGSSGEAAGWAQTRKYQLAVRAARLKSRTHHPARRLR